MSRSIVVHKDVPFAHVDMGVSRHRFRKVEVEPDLNAPFAFDKSGVDFGAAVFLTFSSERPQTPPLVIIALSADVAAYLGSALLTEATALQQVTEPLWLPREASPVTVTRSDHEAA